MLGSSPEVGGELCSTWSLGDLSFCHLDALSIAGMLSLFAELKLVCMEVRVGDGAKLKFDVLKTTPRRFTQHLQPKPRNTATSKCRRGWQRESLAKQPGSQLKCWGWIGEGFPSLEEENGC